MQHNADVPGMSGLGSSSAFTVGFLHALYVLHGIPISKQKLALDAIHIEQERIKESVGSQDQTIAAFGGFNKIVFGGKDAVSVKPVPIDMARTTELQDHLMLFFTGFPRRASDIAAEQIRSTASRTSELAALRDMVDEAFSILVNDHRDLSDFGKLLHEGWMVKRGLTSRITTSVIDSAYEAARKAGALGGKLLGAGGGGFMLFFVRPEQQGFLKEALAKFLHVPFQFENQGSQIIYNFPTDNY